MITAAAAVGRRPAWVAADEVYGRSGKLREACQKDKKGYVLAVPGNPRSRYSRPAFHSLRQHRSRRKPETPKARGVGPLTGWCCQTMTLPASMPALLPTPAG